MLTSGLSLSRLNSSWRKRSLSWLWLFDLGSLGLRDRLGLSYTESCQHRILVRTEQHTRDSRCCGKRSGCGGSDCTICNWRRGWLSRLRGLDGLIGLLALLALDSPHDPGLQVGERVRCCIQMLANALDQIPRTVGVCWYVPIVSE